MTRAKDIVRREEIVIAPFAIQRRFRLLAATSPSATTAATRGAARSGT